MASALTGAAHGAVVYTHGIHDLFTIENLITVPHGDRDKVEHQDARSSQPERSRSLVISALLSATYGATIYSHRKCDLVAIEMLIDQVNLKTISV
jgi:hypothetical protein